MASEMATEVNIPGPIKEECAQTEDQVAPTLLDKFPDEEKFQDHAGIELPQTKEETLLETLSTGKEHHEANIVPREEKPLEINATKQTPEEVIQKDEGETNEVNDNQSLQKQGDASNNLTATIASEEGTDDQKNSKVKDCQEDRTPTVTITDVILNRDEQLIKSETRENVEGDEALTSPGDSEMVLENPVMEEVTAPSNPMVEDKTEESLAQVNDSQMVQEEHSETESKKLTFTELAENDMCDSQLTFVHETVTEVEELKKPESREIENREVDLGKSESEAEKALESLNEAPEAKEASGLGKETDCSLLKDQNLMADPQGIHDDKADDRTVDRAEQKIETLKVQEPIVSEEKIIEDELGKVDRLQVKEELRNSSCPVEESIENTDGIESTLTHADKTEDENPRRSENFEYEEDGVPTLQKEELHVEDPLKSSNLEFEDDKTVIVDQNTETSANDQAQEEPKVTPSDESKEKSVDLAEIKEETCELENAATKEMNSLVQVDDSQMKDEEPIEKEIGELLLTEAMTGKASEAEALIMQDAQTGDDQLRASEYGNNEKNEESTFLEKEIINPIQEEENKSFSLSAGSEQACSPEKLISTEDAQAIMSSETNDSPGKELTPEVDGTQMIQEKHLEKEIENPLPSEASKKETNDAEVVMHEGQTDDESLRHVENSEGEKDNQSVLPSNEHDVPSIETITDTPSTNEEFPQENEQSSSTTEDKENQEGDGEETTEGHSEFQLENLVNKTVIEVEEPKEAVLGESENREVNLGDMELEEDKAVESLDVDSEDIAASGSGQETEICSVHDQSPQSYAQGILDDKAVHEAEQNVETIEFKETIDSDEKTEERLSKIDYFQVKEEHLGNKNESSSHLVKDSVGTTNDNELTLTHGIKSENQNLVISESPVYEKDEEISLQKEKDCSDEQVKFSHVELEDTETTILDQNTEPSTEDLSQNAKGIQADNTKEKSIELADTKEETLEIVGANDVNPLSEMDDSQMKHEEDAEKDIEKESLMEALIDKGNDEEPLITNESQNGDERMRESENLKNVESTPEPEDNNASTSCKGTKQICSAEEQIVVNEANYVSCKELTPEVDGSQVTPEKHIEKETETLSLSKATTKESNDVEALVIHEDHTSENLRQAECSNSEKGVQSVDLNKETEDSTQQFPLVEEKAHGLIEEASHVVSTEEQNLTVDSQEIIDNKAKDAEEEAHEVKNLIVDSQVIIDDKAHDAEEDALESVAQIIPQGVTENSMQIREIMQEPNIQDEDLIKTMLLESEKITESDLVKKAAEVENTSDSKRVASDDVGTSTEGHQTETSVIVDQVLTDDSQENSSDATETKTTDTSDSKEETFKDVFTTDISDRDSERSSQKVDSTRMKNEEILEKDVESPNNHDDEQTITDDAELADAKLLQADSYTSEDSTSILAMESYVRSSPAAPEEIKTFSTHQDIGTCLEDQSQTKNPEEIKEDQEESNTNEIEVKEETADAKNDLTNVSNEGSQANSMTVAEESYNTSEEQSHLTEVSKENEDDESRSLEKSSGIKDNEICSDKGEDKDDKQDTIVTLDGEAEEKKGETRSEAESFKEIVPENGINEIVDNNTESKKTLEPETPEEVLETIVQCHSGNTRLELQGTEAEAEESLREIAPEIKSKDIVAEENFESKENTDEAKDTIKVEIEKMQKVEEDTENQLCSSYKEEVILESQPEDEITKEEEITITGISELGKNETEKGSKDFIETDDKTAGQTESSSPANEATDTTLNEKEQRTSVKEVSNVLDTEEEAQSLINHESMKVNDTGSNTENKEIIEQEELNIVPEDQVQSCDMILKEEQAQTKEEAPMGKNSDVIESKEATYEPDEQMGTENSSRRIEESENDTEECYHNNIKEELITETQSTNQSQQNDKVFEVSEEADIKVVDDEEKTIVTGELTSCAPSPTEQENKDIPEAEELWKDIKSIDQVQASDGISKAEEDTTKKEEPANTVTEMKSEDVKTEEKFEPKETIHEEKDIAKIDISNEKKERDEEVEDQHVSGYQEPYIISEAEVVETKEKILEEETTEPEFDGTSSMIKQSKEDHLHLIKEEIVTDIQSKDEALKICEESEDKASEVTENNLVTDKSRDKVHNKDSIVEEVISTLDTQEQAPLAHHGNVKDEVDDMISSNIETKEILEPKDMDRDVETITEVQSCEIISEINEVRTEEDNLEAVEVEITADKNPIEERLDAANATKEEADNTEVQISSDETKEENGDVGGHHLDSCKNEIATESELEEDAEKVNTNKKLSQIYEEPNNFVEKLAENSFESESTTPHLSEQVKNIDVATLRDTTEEPHDAEQQQEGDPISDSEARILDCKEQNTVATDSNVSKENQHILAIETIPQCEGSMKDALQSDSLPDIKCLDANKVDDDVSLASAESKSTNATEEEEIPTPTKAKYVVLEEDCTEKAKPEISVGNKVMPDVQHEASAEYSHGQCEAAQPYNPEVEQPDNNDPTVPREDVHAKEQNDAEGHEDANTEDEKDNIVEPAEHTKYSSGPDAPVMVDAGDVDVKASHKKSHHLLSGVGSKVKHSIAKVKKAITGKSSHHKPPSPK